MLRWGIRVALMSAQRPRAALAVMVAAVLAMAPGLFRLQLRTDGHALLPGVGSEHLQSLATERSPSFYPGSYKFRPILWPPPRTRERLAEVRRDVAAVDLFRGTLVSYDQRATAILVGVPGPDAADAADGSGAPRVDR